jgi:ADP-ribosyl-[dinitrogen reductase] hydrolase
VLTIDEHQFLEKHYNELTGSGYVIESLESALSCFVNSSSFEESIWVAANIGHDTDTTAAICGQISGAVYGIDAIPSRWVKKLAMKDTIIEVADGSYSFARP